MRADLILFGCVVARPVDWLVPALRRVSKNRIFMGLKVISCRDGRELEICGQKKALNNDKNIPFRRLVLLILMID